MDEKDVPKLGLPKDPFLSAPINPNSNPLLDQDSIRDSIGMIRWEHLRISDDDFIEGSANGIVWTKLIHINNVGALQVANNPQGYKIMRKFLERKYVLDQGRVTRLKIPVNVPHVYKRGKKQGQEVKIEINKNYELHWHWSFYKVIKRRYTDLILKIFQDAELVPFNPKLKIIYSYYSPGKRLKDLDNVLGVVTKFFQDALVEGKLLVDDNWGCILENVHRYGGSTNEKEAYCIVEIIEINT